MLTCANDLILLRTTSIPRASEALSSRTAFLYDVPSISRAKQSIEVVFPIPERKHDSYAFRSKFSHIYRDEPGGPARIILGTFPTWEIALNLQSINKNIIIKNDE